jgi:hypothetical protein
MISKQVPFQMSWRAYVEAVPPKAAPGRNFASTAESACKETLQVWELLQRLCRREPSSDDGRVQLKAAHKAAKPYVLSRVIVSR